MARDAAVPAAYAIVSGQRQEALAGMQVLIDGAGWLRATQPGGALAGGAMPGWNDRRALLAELRSLAAHPIASDAGLDHAQMRM